MKTVASVGVILACLSIPLVAADLNKTSTPISKEEKVLDLSEPKTANSNLRSNPFTGDTVAIEESMVQLKLVKQRRAIAEQKLGEQKALNEIEKMKREATMGTTALN